MPVTRYRLAVMAAVSALALLVLPGCSSGGSTSGPAKASTSSPSSPVGQTYASKAFAVPLTITVPASFFKAQPNSDTNTFLTWFTGSEDQIPQSQIPAAGRAVPAGADRAGDAAQGLPDLSSRAIWPGGDARGREEDYRRRPQRNPDDRHRRTRLRRLNRAGVCQSRGGCLARREGCEVQNLECAAGVLGAAAGLGGVAGYSVYAEEADDEVRDGGPDLGGVSGADE